MHNEVDLAFKIEKYMVIIYEIRSLWNKPEKKTICH
jgi:hypothetical protein